MDLHCITELAVIYNQQHIFENCLHYLAEVINADFHNTWQYDRYGLLELCHNVQKQFFPGKKEIRPFSFTNTFLRSSKLACAFHSLVKYNLSGNHIKNVIEHGSDIRKIINVPLDRYAHDLRLTPLQSYILMNDKIDVSVVKVLIGLGADIDMIMKLGDTLKTTKLSQDVSLSDYSYPSSDDYSSDNDDDDYADNNTVSKNAFQTKTLLMFIISREDKFKMGFREVLELLLYENVSLCMNNSVVAIGLKRYTNKALVDRMYGQTAHYDYNDRAETSEEIIQPGTYVMDANIHESALDYSVPLLIEAGFDYTLPDIEETIVWSDKATEPHKKLERGVNETGNLYRREIDCVKSYLQMCLSQPRPLKLRCRDVLRKHFPRRQIHAFVSAADIPKSIKEFLLLTPILQKLRNDN